VKAVNSWSLNAFFTIISGNIMNVHCKLFKNLSSQEKYGIIEER